MATFVICHGAWSAGWAWKKMRPRLAALGHEVFTATYTGIGDRSHLLHRSLNLDSHIQDVMQMVEYEGLRGIILVGHSYGGMVATGVADRLTHAEPGRVRHLIYVDAFAPRQGQSLLSLGSEAERDRVRRLVAEQGSGWLLPPNPLPADTAAEDQAWCTPRRVAQPVACFEQAIQLTGAVERLPRSYVYCNRAGPGDVFRQFSNRARTEPNWRHFEIDTSHNPHITTPDELTRIFRDIAAA
ncbi:MAG: hypothetical protein RLZZ126_1560 [Pseudomonadota bacterium]|jgi:thioesterase domain-containing protein